MLIKLEELEVYQLSEKVADIVWEVCSSWDWFARETIGRQLVRAADSIGSNIAEGYGRYAFRENVQFCYYARGSMMESRHLIRRARKRKLLSAAEDLELSRHLGALAPKLNAYIQAIKSELHKATSTPPPAK